MKTSTIPILYFKNPHVLLNYEQIKTSLGTLKIYLVVFRTAQLESLLTHHICPSHQLINFPRWRRGERGRWSRITFYSLARVGRIQFFWGGNLENHEIGREGRESRAQGGGLALTRLYSKCLVIGLQYCFHLRPA